MAQVISKNPESTLTIVVEREVVLGHVLTTRRKPNARVEAHIDVVGRMMLRGL